MRRQSRFFVALSVVAVGLSIGELFAAKPQTRAAAHRKQTPVEVIAPAAAVDIGRTAIVGCGEALFLEAKIKRAAARP